MVDTPVKEEERKLWEKWKNNRDEQAANLLVRKYSPLVNFHTSRMMIGLPKNVRKDDIYSQGLYGLFDAIQKFDIHRDLRFDTYASIRIRGAIIDFLRKEDWLSRSSREKAKKIDQAVEQLEQTYQRSVSPAEIAEYMNMSVDEVNQSINESYFSAILSVEDLLKETDEFEQQNQVSLRDTHKKTPEEQVLYSEQIEGISQAIADELNEREKLVLNLFYKEELTLTEISGILGITTSRVSQIHSKSLLKLRKKLLKKKLRDEVCV